ncbi:MAG: PepSY domain-containing protein [bacterium]
MKNIHRTIALSAAVAALTLAASPAMAQAAKKEAAAAKHETQAQLKAEAKITPDAAKATALSKVPGGMVKESELEREKGKLLYSFDIATKGKPGIDEVQIDAITGAQVGTVVHETAAMEKAEARAEAKEKAAAMKHKP